MWFRIAVQFVMNHGSYQAQPQPFRSSNPSYPRHIAFLPSPTQVPSAHSKPKAQYFSPTSPDEGHHTFPPFPATHNSHPLLKPQNAPPGLFLPSSKLCTVVERTWQQTFRCALLPPPPPPKPLSLPFSPSIWGMVLPRGCITTEGRKQVSQRSTHARPGMHMQQCSAVQHDHRYDTRVLPYNCLHLMAFILSTLQCFNATEQVRRPVAAILIPVTLRVLALLGQRQQRGGGGGLARGHGAGFSLAAPVGPSPLYIPTLCGPERGAVWSNSFRMKNGRNQLFLQ